jgi:radical SAM protein with 4Fe4S-binding SPASM domain
MFDKIYIELSNICNLQCHFCPEVTRDKKLMTPADFKKIAIQAKPLTRQICLHLMGEPLAHPNFSEIMDIADELDLKIFLTTNGTLLKKHHEKLLRWRSLEQINFSVHSFFANPNKISLEDYLKPILSFCNQALEIKANFFINLRLWNLEKTNIQNDQNIQVLNLLNMHFQTLLTDQIDVKLNKSKKILNKIYLHFDTEFIWPDLRQPLRPKEGSCYGLRKQLAIHANGDVVPCCLDKESVLKLGNAHLSSLSDIMTSERALKIKTGFERQELVEDLCQRCQYADRFRKSR